MESFERARLDAYFTTITARFAATDRLTSFLVTHYCRSGPASSARSPR